MNYEDESSGLGLNLQNWKQVEGVHHEQFRIDWVKHWLESLSDANLTVLDVGCGTQPYRDHIVNLGYKYVSHDFLNYRQSTKNEFGLHNNESTSHDVDIICDILDIPEKNKFDLILCTEVFEHLPNPVLALEKFQNLLKHNGKVILTFPGLSWTHQAPYYFSSGLSPYWVNYHCDRANLTLIEGNAVGSMRDLINLTMPQYESNKSRIALKILGLIYRFLLKFVPHQKIKVHFAPVLQICVVLQRTAK